MKMLFQRSFDGHFDRRSLLTFTSLGGDFIDTRRRSRRRIGFLQPFLQQRLQFAHIFETQLKGFKSANGRLREDIAVQCAQCQADVRLRETQFDPSLFELFGERFQIVRRWILFFRWIATHIASGTRMWPTTTTT